MNQTFEILKKIGNQTLTILERVALWFGLDILKSMFRLIAMMDYKSWLIVFACIFTPVSSSILQIPGNTLGIIWMFTTAGLLIYLQCRLIMIWNGTPGSATYQAFLRVVAGLFAYSFLVVMTGGLIGGIFNIFLPAFDTRNLGGSLSYVFSDLTRVLALLAILLLIIYLIAVMGPWVAIQAKKKIPNWPIFSSKLFYIVLKRFWTRGHVWKVWPILGFILLNPINVYTTAILPEGYNYGHAFGFDLAVPGNPGPEMALQWKLTFLINFVTIWLLFQALATVLAVDQPGGTLDEFEEEDLDKKADDESDDEDDEQTPSDDSQSPTKLTMEGHPQ